MLCLNVHCVLCVGCASVFTHSICMKCCILKVVLCSLGCRILSWMSQICMSVVMCSDVFVFIWCLSYVLYMQCVYLMLCFFLYLHVYYVRSSMHNVICLACVKCYVCYVSLSYCVRFHICMLCYERL